MPLDRFPSPFQPSEPAGASRLNAMLDMLRPLSNMTGGGITQVTATPDGTSVFTPNPPPSSIGRLAFLRIVGFTSPSTLVGGMYWAEVQRRKAGVPFQVLTVGSLDFGTYYESTTSGTDKYVVVYNPLEALSAAHNVAAATFHWCYRTGETVTDGGGIKRDIYHFIIGLSVAC